jgi:hypothetical protein
MTCKRLKYIQLRMITDHQRERGQRRKLRNVPPVQSRARGKRYETKRSADQDPDSQKASVVLRSGPFFGKMVNGTVCRLNAKARKEICLIIYIL